MTRRNTTEIGSMPATVEPQGVGSHGARADSADLATEVDEQLALMAAAVHTRTQDADKRTARRHQRNRRTVNRWRNLGHGSPVKACLDYVLGCKDPERVAATVLAAARMARLKDKPTSELIRMYWELRTREVACEAEDTRLDSLPLGGATWNARADASEQDGATEILIGSIERLFGVRGVSDAEVYGARP